MIYWGIIGCGNVTEVKSGPAFNKVPDSALVAVMRRNAEQAEDYARRHNVPRFYSDATELINDKQVNAVYIATPPGSHAKYAIEAIKAGKPVYIEKPMAASYKECVEINNTAEKYKVPVFVAYYRRVLPGFLLVKELIESGSIGNVKLIQIQLFKAASEAEIKGELSWRVDPAIAGGGHFFDLASHQLDYLDYLFGPIRQIKSIALNQSGFYKAEDFVTSALVFDKNIVGTGTWCFNLSAESNRDIIEITGDKGTISFSTFSFDPVILVNSSGRKEYINERPEHVQYNLIEKIVNALNGKGESPSTGVSAARTSFVLDEVVKEYYGRKGH